VMQPRCGDMSRTAAPSLARERHSIRGSMHNRGNKFPILAAILLHTKHAAPVYHASRYRGTEFGQRASTRLVVPKAGACKITCRGLLVQYNHDY
jgi:hypothetical protein